MPAKTELIIFMTVNGFVAAIDYIVVLVAVIDIVADRNTRSYAL